MESNETWLEESFDIKLKIKGNPVYIEKSNGTLKCFIEPFINTNLFEYRWLKNGEFYENNKIELNFHNLPLQALNGNYIIYFIGFKTY